MWIFSPSGLLMPGLVPLRNGVSVANPELTRDGAFELQVRGRLRSHLEDFITENFVPLGLEYSEIEATPQMDYNFRFYTTRANLAQAVANQVLNIDYVKYKEQSERKGADGKPMYADGKKFHNVLVRAWSLLTDLNPAGGYYGTYSADNPYGSRSYSTYEGTGRPVTASNSVLAEHYGSDSVWGMDDWTPDSEQAADAIMEGLWADGIPREQWEEELSSTELDLVKRYYPNEFAPADRPTLTKRARKSRKGRRKAQKR